MKIKLPSTRAVFLLKIIHKIVFTRGCFRIAFSEFPGFVPYLSPRPGGHRSERGLFGYCIWKFGWESRRVGYFVECDFSSSGVARHLPHQGGKLNLSSLGFCGLPLEGKLAAKQTDEVVS
jgi:hypothetical protein